MQLPLRWLLGTVFLTLTVASAVLYLRRPSVSDYQSRETLAAGLIPRFRTAPADGATEASRLVMLDSPNDLALEHSDWLRLRLPRAGAGGAGDADQGTAGAVTRVSWLAIPLALPQAGAPLAEAFGPGYRLTALASLAATAFDAQLVSAAAQSLDEEEPTWSWNILPKRNGSQVLTVGLELQWQPVAGGEPIRRPVWQGQIALSVDEPLISSGILVSGTKVSAWLFATLATALLGPLLLELYRSRGAARR